MKLDSERKLLTKLARKNGGMLLVDDVLTEAKDESSPLHKHFEWDDSAAAEAHRRYQARVLIQKCHITVVDVAPTTVRAFVSLQSDRETGGGYRLTTTVLDDDQMREELLRDIQYTIARWTKKFHLLDSITYDLLLKLEEQVTPTAKAKKVVNEKRA